MDNCSTSSYVYINSNFMLSSRHYTDSFLIDHLFPTQREHHGIPPNSNTSSYLSINSNLLTSLDHPTNSFVAVNNFPTHFLLNVREHHGIFSAVSPWCSVGPPHQGTPRRNTKEHQGFSVLQCTDMQSTLKALAVGPKQPYKYLGIDTLPLWKKLWEISALCPRACWTGGK